MKRINFIISLSVIIIFLIGSTIGMFMLPKNNIDNRKVNVAIVNEDAGVQSSSEIHEYGSQLTQEFMNKTDREYKQTTRAAAMEGLVDGTYDLVIAIPPDFSENVLSYDSTRPQSSYVEYYVDPNATQIESLKTQLTNKEIEAYINDTLVQTFTKEVMHSMQELQGKSAKVLGMQKGYQSNFKENVSVPVNKSIEHYVDVMDDFVQQQKSVDSFGTSVETFKSSTTVAVEDEKGQLLSLEDLLKRSQNVSTSITKIQGLIDPITELMDKDQSLAAIREKLPKFTLQENINALKVATLQLEIQARSMEDWKEENVVWKQDIYRQISEQLTATGEVHPETMKASKPLDEQQQQQFNALAKQLTDKLIHKDDPSTTADDNVKSTIDRIMKSSQVTAAVEAVEQQGPNAAKENIESQFAQACKKLPSQLQAMPKGYISSEYQSGIQKADYDMYVSFCTNAGYDVDTKPIAPTYVHYEVGVGKVHTTHTAYDTLILQLSSNVQMNPSGTVVGQPYLKTNDSQIIENGTARQAVPTRATEGDGTKNTYHQIEYTIQTGQTYSGNIVVGYNEEVPDSTKDLPYVSEGTAISQDIGGSSPIDDIKVEFVLNSLGVSSNANSYYAQQSPRQVYGTIMSDGTYATAKKAQLRPGQEEAINSISELTRLSNMYYGQTPVELSKSSIRTAETVLPSDVVIIQQVLGLPKTTEKYTNEQIKETYDALVQKKDVRQYRFLTASKTALIEVLEYQFDEKVLRDAIGIAVADEYASEYETIGKSLDGFIGQLKVLSSGALNPKVDIYTRDAEGNRTGLITPTVSNVWNTTPSEEHPYGSPLPEGESYYISGGTGTFPAEVNHLETRESELLSIRGDFNTLIKNYTKCLEDLKTAKTSVQNVSKDHSEEGKLIVSLTGDQKNLLKTMDGLSASIDTQITQTKEVQERGKQLQSNAESTKKKVEGYRVLVENSKTKLEDITKKNSGFVSDFLNQYTGSKSGAMDNKNFYDNFGSPVEFRGDGDQSNAGTLVPFFIVILIAIFSLIIAYFYNQYRIRNVLSEHHIESRYAGIGKQILLVVGTGLGASLIIAYLGLQALQFNAQMAMTWVFLVVGIGVAFTLLFYTLLYRFKTFGMMGIGMFILLYFITNGAIGLALTNASGLRWLRYINPLIYFEQPLQRTVFGQTTNLLPIVTVIALIIAGSIVITYLLQPSKKEEKFI